MSWRLLAAGAAVCVVLSLYAAGGPDGKAKEDTEEVLATLGAISSHRGGDPAVETAAPLAANAEA